MEQLRVEELKTCFIAKRSILSIFAQMFQVCIRYEETLFRLRMDEYPKIHQAYKSMRSWIDDVRDDLTEINVNFVNELLDQQVKNESDVLVFAYAYMLAVDDKYYEIHQQYQTGGNEVPLCYDSDFGKVVLKIKNKQKLAIHQKRMRERSVLWPKDITSAFKHLHVILNENVKINRLPSILHSDWSDAEIFKIGIAQVSTDPIYETHGDSEFGVKFRITQSNNIRELDKDICNYVGQAFRERVNILLFPELAFDQKLEKRLIRLLDYLMVKHQHYITVVIGYLHTPYQNNESVNLAKCFVPTLDYDLGMPRYVELCRTIKNQPVNFTPGEKGVETISKNAVERGAIEDISPYNNSNVIETPLGRFLLLICKDYLRYQNNQLIDLDLDFVLVNAMTPDKTVTEKFYSKAISIRNLHLVTSVICNNGYFVKAENKNSENNSLGTAPIVSKIDDETKAYEKYFKKYHQGEEILEIFEI